MADYTDKAIWQKWDVMTAKAVQTAAGVWAALLCWILMTVLCCVKIWEKVLNPCFLMP